MDLKNGWRVAKPDKISPPAVAWRLRNRIGLSRVMLVLERGAAAFWPVWTVAFLAYAGFAFDLFAGLDKAQLLAVWGVLAVVVAGLAVLGLRRFRWPLRDEGIARLDDTAPGRPVSALEDEQATGLNDPAAAVLWQSTRNRWRRARMWCA